jgi:hypothetical protein
VASISEKETVRIFGTRIDRRHVIERGMAAGQVGESVQSLSLKPEACSLKPVARSLMKPEARSL